MSQCKRCNGNAGLFKQFCDTCESRNIADEKRKVAQELERKELADLLRWEEEEERKTTAAAARVEKVQASVRSGSSVFLYKSLYLPVDSVVLGEQVSPGFSISPLRELGLEGWEVVGTVPRTLGVALENKVIDILGPVSYGGGIGGNVVGVHLLLRKSIDPGSSDTRAELLRYIAESTLP